MQRLISGSALRLIADSDLSKAAVIRMVWPHLESLKMIEVFQGEPVVMCSIMDLISWIPIVLTTVMVTEEARTLLTQMEKATGKIFRGFWKIGEALKVILDETFPQLIATLYLREF
ncbi:hypothetical protein T03_1859 [Trichinella britovi]|uniref:Uncharacterized protein n=1 Tax=Trichinella britovi TaxID=45882 RepID=A0A0V1C5T9_TRIBR|nr:hypothetical protein T03_1859 [Trichinella britovi]